MSIKTLLMMSTLVQVKPNVTDPDFPSLQLDNLYLEYVQSFNSNQVLFKFVDTNHQNLRFGIDSDLNPRVICLDRVDVLWHKKDWTVPPATPSLSCYQAVKRSR